MPYNECLLLLLRYWSRLLCSYHYPPGSRRSRLPGVEGRLLVFGEWVRLEVVVGGGETGDLVG